MNNSEESEKAKCTEKCGIKWKLKLEGYKHCLEAKMKKKLNVHSLRENHIEFIENNKLVLKSRQRFSTLPKMINYDNVTKQNIKNIIQIGHNHPYTILITGGSESWKTKRFLNLVKEKNDDDFSVINKIYLLKIHMKQSIISTVFITKSVSLYQKMLD